MHSAPTFWSHLLLWLALAVGAQGSVHWEAAELEISPKSTDTLAPAEFRFTNEGPSALIVDAVRPDCGCVSSSPDTRTYAPGESGRVVVVFNVQGQSGEHHIPIEVITRTENKSTRSVLILHVKVRDVVTLSPRFVYWRPPQPREPRLVTVTFAPEEKLRLQDVRSESAAFQVERLPSTDPNHFDLRITPPAEAGRASTLILVTTVSAGHPEPVSHRILARTW